MIAKYELTWGQWRGVVGLRGDPDVVDMPADELTWYDCRSFCEKVGLQMPTEAQWVYACWGGGEKRQIEDAEWHLENSGRRPHKGGELMPNGYGLFDMNGNVSEWCEDIYDDPEFSGLGYRVIGGGTYLTPVDYCGCGETGGDSPGIRMGFRPVLAQSPEARTQSNLPAGPGGGRRSSARLPIHGSSDPE